jgi:hypothetical protein
MRANPLKLHVDDLQAYAAHDVTVSFSAAGADDCSALVAWGEIDPGFGAKQVLLAYKVAGTDLCSTGPTLVVPGDLNGGRDVSTIVKLHVGRAGRGAS